MSDWIDFELADQMTPVAAPECLWERIETARRAPAKAPVRWPIAAVVTLITAAATLWVLELRGQTPFSLEQLAAQELHRSGPLDFDSGDPAAVAAWIRANAGVEIGLPDKTPVRILGASMIRRSGMRIGAVRYEAAGAPAILLISRASAAGDRAHRYFSLACEGPTEAACQLCHI